MIFDNNDLNFNIDNPIEGTHKVDPQGDLIVYWTDDLNTPRAFNVDRQQRWLAQTPSPIPNHFEWLYGINPGNSHSNHINLLDLFPNSGPVPKIELDYVSTHQSSVTEGGGLLTGVYYLALALVDEYFIKTNNLTISTGNNLNIRANHSTGYKKRTTWTLEEDSKTNELIFDYNNITLSLFESDTGIQNQDGIELSYKINNFEIFASKLNSKKNGVVQLRRPEITGGFNYIYNFNDFNIITSYNYIGESKDIHNSNWSIIDMKELHLLNFGIEKYGFTLDISNLLNQDYQMPHGFTGKERQVTIGFTKKY